jgi:hypothetical protein
MPTLGDLMTLIAARARRTKAHDVLNPDVVSYVIKEGIGQDQSVQVNPREKAVLSAPSNVEGLIRTALAKVPYENPGVAEIFRRYGNRFLEEQRARPSREQWKCLHDILRCRSLYGEWSIQQCTEEECGGIQATFRSCNNRGCPRCQGKNRARWYERRMEEWSGISVEAEWLTFHIPEKVYPLVLQNPKALLKLMFDAASHALSTCEQKAFGVDMIGYSSVLQTWGKGLVYFPHLHVLLIRGGFQSGHWVPFPPGSAVDLDALGKEFMDHYLAGLRNKHPALARRGSRSEGGTGKDHAGKRTSKTTLRFGEDLARVQGKRKFQAFLDALREKSWRVDHGMLESTADAARYARYLAKGVNSGPLGKAEVELNEGKGKVEVVLGVWTNGSANEHRCSLDPVEFIRRYLLHVPPSRFTYQRYFGFLSGRNRKKWLEAAGKIGAGNHSDGSWPTTRSAQASGVKAEHKPLDVCLEDRECPGRVGPGGPLAEDGSERQAGELCEDVATGRRGSSGNNSVGSFVPGEVLPEGDVESAVVEPTSGEAISGPGTEYKCSVCKVRTRQLVLLVPTRFGESGA